MFRSLVLASAAALTLIGSNASAFPNCPAPESDASGLLRCYQDEFAEKLSINNERYHNLTAKTKELLDQVKQEKAPKLTPRQTSAYAELLRKINHAVTENRRIATTSCVKLAAKFSSEATSAIAVVNCRTEHEVELDKELRRLELQYEVLSLH